MNERIRVALLSDTHGHMDERILHHVSQCDEVWHAGDIGSASVLQRLESKAKMRAVFGNIDGHELRMVCPEHLEFEVAGTKVWMTHIGGRPPKYARGVHVELKRKRPDLFVCGHSHILLVQPVASWGGLHLNPGAVGVSGFHKKRTMLTFELQDGQVEQLKVIEWDRSGA